MHLEERAFVGPVEAWVFGGVAAHVEATIGMRAREEDARVAVERAKVDALNSVAGSSITKEEGGCSICSSSSSCSSSCISSSAAQHLVLLRA